jgi:formiminoglutamase
MCGASTSGGAWYSRLEPFGRPADLPARRDDPRLGTAVTFWAGGEPGPRAGQAVLLGFPQDEGVRRNGGRPGAALAPAAIRHWLYRLTPWDGAEGADLTRVSLLDLGDVKIEGGLEATQEALAAVLAAVLARGAVPVVLGGGHETALGHYLGHARAGGPVAILNLDAHLDVRSCLNGLGHSGSPFRQALEHPTHPLPGRHYVCLGAQPHAVSRDHADYARRSGCAIRWCPDVRGRLASVFSSHCRRLKRDGCRLYVTLDADVVQTADVPAVSAPNPGGLAGVEVLECVRQAGATPGVASFDLVEICPPLDRDDQGARWAALAVWHFLAGLAMRE